MKDSDPADRTLGDSAREFFGNENKKEYSKFLEFLRLVEFKGPIPGYTGHARRIAADNIYGATFANARKKAQQSNSRIEQDRQQNLREVSQMIPPVSK